MEKEFIPYEEALALKELGFDEHCHFGHYIGEIAYWKNPYNHNESNVKVSAPLYQQAFRWFRDKYDLNISIQGFENNSYRYSYTFCIYNRFHQLQDYEFGTDVLMTYEEAELECLKKLIEIVEPKSE